MSFPNAHTFRLPAVHAYRYTEISHKTRAVFACYDPAFVAGSLDGERRLCWQSFRRRVSLGNHQPQEHKHLACWWDAGQNGKELLGTWLA